MKNVSFSLRRHSGIPSLFPYLGFLTVSGLVLSPAMGLAQAPDPQATQNIIRQVESLQREQVAREQQAEAVPKPVPQEGDIPETYPGENADLGPQMLLKQKKPQRKPLFEFNSDTMFTWTSNALGTPQSRGNARQDTGAVAETLSLALAPEPFAVAGGKLSLRAGYRHLIWMYDVKHASAPLGASATNLNTLNFEMSTVFVGANLSFKENWNAAFGVDYNRILTQAPALDRRNYNVFQRSFDPSQWTEQYVELKPNWSLSRNIGITEKLNVSVSYSGAYRFSQTDALISAAQNYPNSGDNFENGISVSLICIPLERLMLIPTFRLTHYAYTQSQSLGGHRQDRTISPGLTAIYALTERVSLRFSTSGEFRHSTAPENSGIKKFDTGAGVSCSVKF